MGQGRCRSLSEGGGRCLWEGRKSALLMWPGRAGVRIWNGGLGRNMLALVRVFEVKRWLVMVWLLKLLDLDRK